MKGSCNETWDLGESTGQALFVITSDQGLSVSDRLIHPYALIKLPQIEQNFLVILGSKISPFGENQRERERERERERARERERRVGVAGGGGGGRGGGGGN